MPHPLARVFAFLESRIPIGVLAALFVALFVLGGCNQAQRDAQADKVDQTVVILEHVLEHLTAENVDQGLDLVIQLAPIIGRDDLAARAIQLQAGAADDAVAGAREIITEAAAQLSLRADDLRDPGVPTWQVVLNSVLGIATVAAGAFGLKGRAAAGTLQRVVAGVQGLTESGALSKADRKAAMGSLLSAKDDATIRSLLARDAVKRNAAVAGVKTFDVRLATPPEFVPTGAG